MSKNDAPPGMNIVALEQPKTKDRNAHKRYSMDKYAATNIKEAGRKATMRLHALLDNDAQWEELAPQAKLSAIDLAMTRAFGRVETESADAKLSAADEAVHGGMLPNHLREVAKTLNLPELQGQKKAEK